MVSHVDRSRFAAQLAEDNLSVAQSFAFHLKAYYPWVAAEDLRSYSLWGLLLVANASQSRQEGGLSW